MKDAFLGTMAIAFIIGPLLGGILWQYGSGVPFFASSGAGLVGFLVAIFFLQESYFPNKEKIENVIDTNDDDIKVDVSMDDITEAKTDDNANETKEDTVAITDDKKIEIGDGAEEEKQENPCQKIPVPVWLILNAYFFATLGYILYIGNIKNVNISKHVYIYLDGALLQRCLLNI